MNMNLIECQHRSQPVQPNNPILQACCRILHHTAYPVSVSTKSPPTVGTFSTFQNRPLQVPCRYTILNVSSGKFIKCDLSMICNYTQAAKCTIIAMNMYHYHCMEHHKALHWYRHVAATFRSLSSTVGNTGQVRFCQVIFPLCTAGI